MADKSFVLLSLNDEKAKKLSNVLGNVTCRKILDYLASKGEATETQISKDLKIAISTVHYNLNLLDENGLVSKDEYHYSEKGKEVIHYKMKNRYIVIAPDHSDEKSILDKLKGIIPAAIILAAGTLIVGFFDFFFRAKSASTLNIMAAKTMASESADAAGAAAVQTAMPLARSAPVVSSQPHFTLWFFAGGVMVLIGVLLWNLTRK
jgi:DNA-binding transcriptional ArsR family regulator